MSKTIEKSYIPDGWQIVRLERVAEVNPRRPRLSVDAEAAVTFLPMAAVSTNCGGVTVHQQRPYREVSKGYTYFLENDVLFAKITPCLQNGKHVLATNLEMGFGFGTTEFHVIRAGPNIEPRHLYRVVTQPANVEKCARSFAGTAGQQRVQPEVLKALHLHLPPISEQQRIAVVLDSIDDTIEQTDRLIAATERLRDSLLHELMTKGLPGWHTEWQEHPNLGTIPTDWGIMHLGEIADVVGGSTPARSEASFWGGSLPWVVPSEVSQLSGRYLHHTKDTMTEIGARSAGIKVLPAGSVLLTTRATIGVTAICAVPTATNQGFQSLVPRNGTDSLWLYYCINALSHQLTRRAAGSTFREVSRQSVRGLPVPFPPLREQQAIAEVLDSVDNTVEKADGERAALAAFKESISDALLTGRVRVPGHR